MLVPVGFVSDHMEVVYDLDTEALATAERLGLDGPSAPRPRAPTRGSSRWCATCCVERAAAERGEGRSRAAVGEIGPLWDRCPVGCCPNPRGDVPAIGGE